MTSGVVEKRVVLIQKVKSYAHVLRTYFEWLCIIMCDLSQGAAGKKAVRKNISCSFTFTYIYTLNMHSWYSAAHLHLI